MSGNKTWFIDGPGQKGGRVGDTEIWTPGEGEVVVKNHAIAINPVDWKVQASGMMIRDWPIVLGCDVAGEVEAVGQGVERFKKGDRVIAHSISLMKQSHKHGGFQHYTAVPAVLTAKIPDNLSFTDAVVLPLSIDTAVHGLYAPSPFLGLPYASLDPTDTGKTILLWGGSSSVGASVIQLCVSSGVKVVATASKRNFDFCKNAGAAEVVDYSSPSVVDDVVAAVKKVGGTFAGVYDAIGLRDQSFRHISPILEKLGGNVNLASVLPAPKQDELPEGVKAGNVFAINDITHKIWAEYVYPALEQGKLKPLPPPLVIGKGLEHLQAGLDKNKAGVSAQKVVIEL